MPICPQWYMVGLMFQSTASNLVVEMGCGVGVGSNGLFNSAFETDWRIAIDFCCIIFRSCKSVSAVARPTAN